MVSQIGPPFKSTDQRIPDSNETQQGNRSPPQSEPGRIDRSAPLQGYPDTKGKPRACGLAVSLQPELYTYRQIDENVTKCW